MNSLIMLATLWVGQCGVVVGPTTYIDYLYGTMVVESKFNAVVRYDDGRRWRVVVVNGYVPRITTRKLTDGGVHYVYDYREHIPYEPPMPHPEPYQLSPEPVKPKSVLVPIERPRPGMARPLDVDDPQRVVAPKYHKSVDE